MLSVRLTLGFAAMFLIGASVLFGFLYWELGRRLEEREDQAELERQSIANWRRKP